MSLLESLLAQMRAAPDLSEIQVVENHSVDDETFAFKVCATVEPHFLQIRFLADKNLARYSFQLYGDRPLLRWDNSPHYPDLSGFPHHFHNQTGDVFPSRLTGDLLGDFEIVMQDIRSFMSV